MPIKKEMDLTPDLVHEARHFRTVLTGFIRNVDLLFAQHQPVPDVDVVALAAAFAQWRQGFDATRHLADTNRSDFVVYSAGSLLKEMLGSRPLACAPENTSSLCELGLARWPEGYAYASFCLSVASAVLESLGEKLLINERLASNPGFWNSFRENVTENRSTAVGFFDMLCGVEPNWDGPDILWYRPDFRNAGRTIAEKRLA